MAQRICVIDDCGKPQANSRGWCNKHYLRWRKHGDPLDPGAFIVGDDEARFWSHVDKAGPVPQHRPELGPCWLWTASKNAGGYGLFSIAAKPLLAHRWSYTRFVGPIPDGLTLDHLCRVHECVNPAHLEPTTVAENIRRATDHYGARTHCNNGHEFTPENTMVRSDGGRRCRTCKRERSRKSAQLKKEVI